MLHYASNWWIWSIKTLIFLAISHYDLAQTNLVKLHVDTGNAASIIKKPTGNLAMWTKHAKTGVAGNAWSWYNCAHYSWAKCWWCCHRRMGHPCVICEKKYGTRRLCVQFQDLTAVTVKDPWPPLIQDPVESFRDAKVLSALDLLKAFSQIAVDERSVHKLTMTTQWGCFSYNATPLVSSMGRATFQGPSIWPCRDS